ncbi:MAG TPA: hypothetical protein VKB49_03520 [Candidatus Sulfotelmatobacter sp.]|nr:hypothetical protein [Candidatus Sulfotelmatobacter sp.]
MRKDKFGSFAIKSFALLVALATAYRAMPQDATAPYPAMAPVEQYLMDRDAEISTARSAAPDAISRDASVIVLTRHGYETAVEGKNGWVCWVGRGWMAMFDHPEFWNPKVRAADCLNPPAARSVLPYAYKRTELILAGHSKQEVIAAIKAAIDKKELPTLEQGTVSYMMSKSSYLTDYGNHNMPHLMFFQTDKSDTAWGANLTNSPVLAVNYWYMSAEAYPQLKTFPPLSVFLVAVDKWSDGSPALNMLNAQQ